MESPFSARSKSKAQSNARYAPLEPLEPPAASALQPAPPLEPPAASALQPRAGAMPAEAAEPVEMPAKPAEPVEPVEDKNEDESEDRSEDESEDESESESKAQDESEDFAVFCFETQSNGVRLTLALGLGHVWRSPKLRRAFQGTRDFFGSYKGSCGRPHCLKLLCALYKWMSVEEAKDFLGFGSE